MKRETACQRARATIHIQRDGHIDTQSNRHPQSIQTGLSRFSPAIPTPTLRQVGDAMHIRCRCSRCDSDA